MELERPTFGRGQLPFILGCGEMRLAVRVSKRSFQVSRRRVRVFMRAVARRED
jgi:hypothetical protein